MDALVRHDLNVFIANFARGHEEAHTQLPSKHETFSQCCFIVGRASLTSRSLIAYIGLLILRDLCHDLMASKQSDIIIQRFYVVKRITF